MPPTKWKVDKNIAARDGYYTTLQGNVEVR